MGTYNAIRHPIDTATALVNAISDPKAAAEAFWADIVEKSQTVEGQAEIAGDILQTFLSGGAAKATSTTGRLGKILSKVDDLPGGRLGDELFSSGGRASQVAPVELLDKLKARGYEIFDGPDIEKHLDRMGANASTFGQRDLLLRPDPRKLEVIEEYLHNVQVELGIDPAVRELHVAAFMHQHRTLLGLDQADTLARLVFEMRKSGLLE
ncbi:MAG: hypothetical protein ACK5Q5_00970 [Planctomycetaceae bacterium]